MPLTRSKVISTPDRPSTEQTRELPPSRRSGTADADSDRRLAVRMRSRKVVVDAERPNGDVSDLTVDDARAMAADIMDRLEALRRRWEASGDLQALLGGLIFFGLQLPKWLYKGLIENLKRQFRNPDATRFLTVRYAHDVLGKTMDESYDWASENLDDPTARGGRDTMMRAYKKIRLQVAAIDRIQRRPRAPRRRSIR
jgi:hypothetical protein